MAEIALQGIQKRFGDSLAINNLKLTIGDGELVVLLVIADISVVLRRRC